VKKKPSGQSLVEVALVLPILLMIFLGLVDFGRVYYVMVSLFDAADEGAIYAAAYPDPSRWPEVKRRAASATSALITLQESDVDDPQFATWPPAAGTPVTVTVYYDFTFYTPVATMFFPDSTVTLRGQAVKAVIGGN
jgi:Flp pilus assembly protein TadG